LRIYEQDKCRRHHIRHFSRVLYRRVLTVIPTSHSISMNTGSSSTDGTSWQSGHRRNGEASSSVTILNGTTALGTAETRLVLRLELPMPIGGQ